MVLLQHIHIPSTTNRFPTYALAVAIQSKLQQRLLDYKAKAALATADPANSRSLPPPPPPTLLSFTPAPTYTLGRRQTSPLSDAETARLRAPLDLYWYKHPKGYYKRNQDGGGDKKTQAQQHPGNMKKYGHNYTSFRPDIHNAPRGGLATYHGPGQVVFWPVLDLRSPLHRHFTVRDYACLLEKTTIASIAAASSDSLPSFPPAAVRQREVQGFTTENPGVWVRHERQPGDEEEEDDGAGGGGAGDERKIAALGVHLRRHVTGLGVAVNCSMPVRGSESRNPWRRIVACGLEDKRVTSLAYEMLNYANHEHWVEATAPRPLEPPQGTRDKYWAEAPILEAALLRAWPEFLARSLLLETDDASTTATAKREDLVAALTLDSVLGRGWQDTIGIPHVEQYATGPREKVMGAVDVEWALGK